MRRDGCTHLLSKSSFCARSVQAWPVAVRHADSTIHKHHNHLAWLTDSAVGRFLSLGVSSDLGIRTVFLHGQLFDGRKRRSASSQDVANFGRSRKWHWRTDGWTLGKLHLCAYHRARCARGTVLSRARLDDWTGSTASRADGSVAPSDRQEEIEKGRQ